MSSAGETPWCEGLPWPPLIKGGKGGRDERPPGDDRPPGHAGLLEAARPTGGACAFEEEHGELHEAIRRLPLELRLPLVLYYFDGQSVRGVAESLALSPATVCQRLKEARRVLHEETSAES